MRIPVSTQEPVSVRTRVVRLQNRRVALSGAVLSSVNPYEYQFDVPQGCNYRVFGVYVQWSRVASNRQMLSMNIETDRPDGLGNVLSTDFRSLIDENAAFSVNNYYVAKIGGGALHARITDSTGDIYVLDERPLPDVWLYGGCNVEVLFYNAHVNDSAIVWIAYEEEVV